MTHGHLEKKIANPRCGWKANQTPFCQHHPPCKGHKRWPSTPLAAYGILFQPIWDF